MSTLIELNNVSKTFDVSLPWLNRVLEGKGKQLLHAVSDVSFTINKGETLALVGESGCGKSTVARLICGLYAPTGGNITFDGQPMQSVIMNDELARAQRRRVQMIFQDPYASLNPRWRVRDIVAEPIRVHGLVQGDAAIEKRVTQLLDYVKLASADGEKFPHQFSGGQRQRISIARALASQPEFLVCDEPTSALDVSVQAQVLNLMKDLQRELKLTYLFISHNLAVVHHIADRVGVMYLGRVVELANKHDLFKSPKHPYTRMLLDAIPDLQMTGRSRTPVAGEVPNPLNPPKGCTFHPRCPKAQESCSAAIPALANVGNRLLACPIVASA
jgi:peptide/nickel transport system ATP-binding protein